MSITLELTPAEEDVLRQEAAAHHCDVDAYIREKLFTSVAVPHIERPTPQQARGQAAQLAALFALWEEQDPTSEDPQERERREQEHATFKARMNEARALAGEAPLYE